MGEEVTGRSELADGGGSPPGDRDWRKGDEGFHGGDQVGHGSASPRGGRGRPGGGGPRTGPASPSARASLHSKLISNRKGLWKGLGFSRTATFSTDTLAIASPRLAAPQQGQGQGQGLWLWLWRRPRLGPVSGGRQWGTAEQVHSRLFSPRTEVRT